jgi:hypothetical protein
MMLPTEQFRNQMEERWRAFEDAAMAVGEGGNMVIGLAGPWYRELDSAERALADEVLSDWVLHDTPRQRPALALIVDFRIRSARPALRQLLARLGRTAGPVARDLGEEVQRVIATLKGEDAIQ